MRRQMSTFLKMFLLLILLQHGSGLDSDQIVKLLEVINFRSLTSIILTRRHVDIAKKISNSNMWLGSKKLLLKKSRIETPVFAAIKSDYQLQQILALVDENNLGTEHQIILLLQRNVTMLNNKLRINQQVYTINASGFEITETYVVGNIRVRQVVGKIVYNNDNSNGSKLILDQDWSRDIGARRKSFFGNHLSAISAQDPPYSLLNPGFDVAPNVDQWSGLYKVGHAHGLYIEVFNDLAKEVNFTYTILAEGRQLVSFGSVVNDTMTGLLSYLTSGLVDLFAGAVTFNLPRSHFVRYLPRIYGKRPSIFIQNNQAQDLDWLTFVKPMSIFLWIALLLQAFVIASCLFLVNRSSICFRAVNKLRLFSGWFWFALSANVRGFVRDPLPVTGFNRCLLITTLLSGYSIWMGYKAAITSELAIKRVTLPFTSPETLLSTDFMFENIVV